MLRAVLFDLDGTLLPLDTRSFLKKYTAALSKKISAVMEPDEFLDHLFYATEKMIGDLNPNMTNAEVFWMHMSQRVPDKIETLLPLVNEFYEKDFKLLGSHISADTKASELVKRVRQMGFKTVLATNPVFPEKAVLERMRWALLNPEDFDLITTYENMHFCKPHLEYYKEVLDKINEVPENCLMVGNDVEEDMVVKKIGMKTFLVEDFVISRKNCSISCDYQGTLKDLENLLLSCQHFPDKNHC